MKPIPARLVPTPEPPEPPIAERRVSHVHICANAVFVSGFFVFVNQQRTPRKKKKKNKQ